MLVHEPIGKVGYPRRPYWPHHAEMARTAVSALAGLHRELDHIDRTQDDIRVVSDEHAARAYELGTSMVTNVERAVSHLAHEMASKAGAEASIGSARPLDELCTAAAAVGIDCRVDAPGYHAVGEMVAVRHAIDHPNDLNVYRAGDADWDQVPLAWILSDRSTKAFRAYAQWFELIVADWKVWLAVQASESRR